MKGRMKRSGVTLEEMKQALEGKLYIGKKIKKIVFSERAAQARYERTRKQELSHDCIHLCLRWILENTQNHSDTDNSSRKERGGSVMKRNWKRTLFYIRRGLIRWAVMFFGTLLALCGAMYILENPDGRMLFYLVFSITVSLMIGNLFYGRDLPKK